MVSLASIYGTPRIDISPTSIRTGRLIEIVEIDRGLDRLCYCDLRIDSASGERLALIAVPPSSMRTWDSFRHAALDAGLALDPKSAPADWSTTVYTAAQRGESRGAR